MLRFILSKGPFQVLAARWIHPSVLPGECRYDEHLSALSAALVAAIAAVSFLPLSLVFAPAALAFQPLVFALAAAPLLFIATLSLSGKLHWARWAGLGVVAAGSVVTTALTGGYASTLLPLLVIFMVEPGLWGARRSFVAGLAIVAGCLSSLLVLDLVGVGQHQQPAPNVAIVAAIVVAYAASVVVRLPRRSQPRHALIPDLQERLLQSTGFGLLTLFNANGGLQTIFGNSRAVVGRDADELLAKRFLETLHIQDRLTFLHAISLVLQSGETQHCRLRIKSGDDDPGSWIAASLRLSPFSPSDHAGGIAGVLTVDRDQNASLQEQTGSSRYKQFLAVVSHELRTPLNAIIGFSDILKEELFGKFEFERQREYAGHINASGHHLLNIVNDLLDVSRIEAGKYELSLAAFLPTSMAYAVVDMLSPVASKAGVTLVHDLPQDLPEMFADSRACRQILINLLSNAIKFTKKGGAVRLAAREKGDTVVFSVTDDGIGMSEEFVARIGEPFCQAHDGRDRDHDGVGLGLSIVKGLTDLHGGNLEIDSEPGVGTTIRVRIPKHVTSSRPVPHNETVRAIRQQTSHKPAEEQQPDDQSSISKGEDRARLSA